MARKPPLIEGQGVRFASLGVGLLLGLGIVLVVLTLVSDDPVPIRLLTGVGAGALVLALGATLLGLLIGRRAFGQRLEVALRPTGESTWQHGRLDASPGRLEFTPYTWQLRFFTGSSKRYAVLAVGEDTGQRPPRKQLWSVNPALHVIDIETDGGPLQLGVQGHQVDDIRQRLALNPRLS